MEANAILAERQARSVEQRCGARGIVVVRRRVAVVGPMIWRQQARRQPRLPAQQIFDYGFAIRCVRERATNIALRE